MGDLELESRRAIYSAVVATPGIHFRGLLEELDYAQGTVQYHLRRLASDGLVEVSDDGQYTRYYPAGEFDETDRRTMDALRRTYSRRIIAHLLADGPISTTVLADRLGKAPSTVSWHLSKLDEAGLVTRERAGRSVRYDLVDPDRARRLYAAHQPSFTDRLVDRLVALWDSY